MKTEVLSISNSIHTPQLVRLITGFCLRLNIQPMQD